MAGERNEHPGEWYEIKLDGHLDERWLDWFEGFSFSHRSDGTTSLTGPVVDQAALHGVLKKLRDLGIPIVSFARVDPNNPHTDSCVGGNLQ